MMMDWGWGGGMGWGFGMFGMLLFWIVVIAGIVALLRWMTAGPAAGTRSGDRALEILRERYARGEIDREEYEARRRDLA
jgi:putative membrane protein